MEQDPKLPIEAIYTLLATSGGIARYLTGYANGKPFKAGIFCASAIASGFSGFMFAQLGVSMGLPQPMLFVMAGTGGFFGEQTMKLILERVSKNKNK